MVVIISYDKNTKRVLVMRRYTGIGKDPVDVVVYAFEVPKGYRRLFNWWYCMHCYPKRILEKLRKAIRLAEKAGDTAVAEYFRRVRRELVRAVVESARDPGAVVIASRPVDRCYIDITITNDLARKVALALATGKAVYNTKWEWFGDRSWKVNDYVRVELAVTKRRRVALVEADGRVHRALCTAGDAATLAVLLVREAADALELPRRAVVEAALQALEKVAEALPKRELAAARILLTAAATG